MAVAGVCEWKSVVHYIVEFDTVGQRGDVLYYRGLK